MKGSKILALAAVGVGLVLVARAAKANTAPPYYLTPYDGMTSQAGNDFELFNSQFEYAGNLFGQGDIFANPYFNWLDYKNSRGVPPASVVPYSPDYYNPYTDKRAPYPVEEKQGFFSLAADAVASVGGAVAHTIELPRGVRNNNPGNLEWGSADWDGLKPNGRVYDERFCVFINPWYGIRAMAMNLKNYKVRYGLSTLTAIITRYAPPFKNGKRENDTEGYIAFVSKQMGVAPTAFIDVSRFETLLPLVNAMIWKENTYKYSDDEMVKDAVRAAIDLHKPPVQWSGEFKPSSVVGIFESIANIA